MATEWTADRPAIRPRIRPGRRRGLQGDRVEIEVAKRLARKRGRDKPHRFGPLLEGSAHLVPFQNNEAIQPEIAKYNSEADPSCARPDDDYIHKSLLHEVTAP